MTRKLDALKNRALEDDALHNLGNDAEILRDGESFRVPMVLMDAQQRDAAGEYGALGGTHAFNWIQQSDPAKYREGEGTPGYQAAHPPTPKPAPEHEPLTPRESYMVQLREAWKNPLQGRTLVSRIKYKCKRK